MHKAAFEKYNQQLIEQGLSPLANPRNAASGSLRMKDPKEVAARNLDAFLYHVSYVTGRHPNGSDQLSSHSNTLDLLWQMGFRSPKEEKK